MESTVNNVSVQQKVIEQIKTNKKFCDLKIIASNGAEIFVNADFLSRTCPLFGRQRKRRIPVKAINGDSISSKLFSHVIKFPYSGYVNFKLLNEFEILRLYNVSKMIRFSELTALVESKLYAIEIELENVGKLFELALTHQLTSLAEKCSNFVDYNSKMIIEMLKDKDAEKQRIVGSFPKKLILYIAASDTFSAEEVDIFDLIKFWGEISGDKETVDIALKMLRLEHVEIHSFKSIKESGLISADYYFDVQLQYAKNKRNKRQQAKSINAISTSNTQINSFVECQTITSTIAHNCLHQFLDEKSGDVVFIDCSGEDIIAHSSILAASTPFFENLLDEAIKATAVEEIRDLIEFKEDSIRLLLKYALGEPLKLEALNEETVIDLFLLTKKVGCIHLNELVAVCLQRIEINADNLVELYFIATENIEHINHENTKTEKCLNNLLKNCFCFLDGNSSKLLENNNILKELPLQLLTRIVAQRMDQPAFRALNWLQQNKSDFDLVAVTANLPIESMSLDQYLEIEKYGIISAEQFMEGKRNKRKPGVNVNNVSCKTHSQSLCKLIPQKFFKVGAVHLTPLDNDNGCFVIETNEQMVFELNEKHQVNYIKFRLFDNPLRVYNYEMKVCAVKSNSDMTIVKHAVRGQYHVSTQEVVFQPRVVKSIYITAIDGPLKIYSDSFDVMFRPDLEFETFISGMQYAGDNLIVDTKIDDISHQISLLYPILRCNENEVVYVLRYPFKLNSAAVTFNSELNSEVKMYTKEDVTKDWVEITTFSGINFNWTTIVTFKKSLVSFVKLSGWKIKDKIKCIQCPATADQLKLAVL